MVPYLVAHDVERPDLGLRLAVDEHEAERAAFFLDCAKAIGESGLTGFNSLVRLKDFGRFNSEHGLNLEAYALAAYG